MKQFFIKPYRWAVIFTLLLIGSFTYVLLDTFVIPKSYAKVTAVSNETDSANTRKASAATEGDSDSKATETSSEASPTEVPTEVQSKAIVTDTSYEDNNIKINISTIKEYNTAVYVADVMISDISYLKTALADDTYGRNIKAATSEIAKDNNAIFAINGDFYGFRDYGYVLRNGELYRDTAGNAQDLVIDNIGDFSIVNENDTTIDSMDLSTIWQILSFGPALVEDGNIVVDEDSEVSRSMSSNPRTAIGMISPLHYVFIVSDGRTDESAGLSLLQLAQIFTDYGCTSAYNLDGGGSATMYFNGEIVNIPTDGRFFGEREVSDIVYLGY
jgi:exopolysaccharide biosynthesis protein